MKLIRVSLVVMFCVGAAAGAVVWLLDLAPGTSRHAGRPRQSNEPGRTPGRSLETSGSLEVQKKAAVYDIVFDKFEDGGYTTATQFMAPIRDLGSLQELREAVRGRGRRGISTVRAQLEQLMVASPLTHEQIVKKLSLEQSIGLLYMYEGKFLEAASWLEKALETSRPPDVHGHSPDRTHGRPGDRGHAARGDRELPGVRGPVELHFPDRQRGRASKPGGLARGHQVVHVFTSRSLRETCGSSGS